MQSVSKLVEQSDHFVPGQQGWLALWWLWNVEVVYYNCLVSSQGRLIYKVVHPCTTAL